MADETSNSGGLYYIPISMFSVPLDDKGACADDLFIFLPVPKRYIVFIQKGEKFTFSKQNALKKHLFPILFVKHYPDGSTEIEKKQLDRVMESEAVSEKGAKNINEVCEVLFEASDTPAAAAIQRFEKLADDILQIVAPDVQNIRQSILENASYLWVMNDSSAISTIATLFAMANNIGIDSKKPLRDIVCATLIMDFPLAKIGEETMKQFYLDPSKLTKEVVDQIRQHPLDAYKMAQRKLEHFSDVTFELILNHHELYNGTGYPKKLRTGTMSPFVQIFCFAVDVFETLKRAQLKDEPVTLNEVIMKAMEKDVDTHLKRHNTKVVDAIVKYMGQSI